MKHLKHIEYICMHDMRNVFIIFFKNFQVKKMASGVFAKQSIFCFYFALRRVTFFMRTREICFHFIYNKNILDAPDFVGGLCNRFMSATNSNAINFY